MSNFERKFVLKQIFSRISKFELWHEIHSDEKTHFGVSWKLVMERYDEFLSFYLYGNAENGKHGWKIDVEYEITLISPNGNHTSKKQKSIFDETTLSWGFDEFLEYDTMLEEYVLDDKIKVEAHVKIIKMTGILKKRLRDFDEKDEKLTDVTLIVDDEKFHVSKAVLASQSAYFHALFFGNFAEAGKEEIELKKIDAVDFQDFLELIYGESAVSEKNVERLLKLAEMYDAPAVTKKCQVFLMHMAPEFSMKEKLRISVQFKLDDLQTDCFSKINTISEIRAVLPLDLMELDKSMMATLFEKTLSLPANRLPKQ